MGLRNVPTTIKDSTLAGFLRELRNAISDVSSQVDGLSRSTLTQTTSSGGGTAPPEPAPDLPVLTTLVLAVDPPNPAVGATVTLSASVVGNTPTGTVAFYDSTALLATVSVTDDLAIYTTSGFTQGTHSLYARYSGDARNYSSSSNLVTLVVGSVWDGPPPTPTSLTAEGVIGYVAIKWTNSYIGDRDVTEVWASLTDNVAVASKLGESAGSVFLHKPAAGSPTWYYWVRNRDAGGLYSAYYDPNAGTTSVIEGTVGSITTVTGTAPITVSSNPTTPIIAITAATTSAAGSMSAADKAKLDGISAGAAPGTVTSVGGTGTVSGLSLSGTVTTSGNLTLGGTLDLSLPPAIGGTTPAAGNFTTLGATGNTTLGDASSDTLTINGTAVSCPNNLNFDSNTLFIDATNNRVGVGTNSPLGPLEIAGSAGTVRVGATGDAVYFSRNGINYIVASGGANGALQFQTGGSIRRMDLNQNGAWSLRTAADSAKVSISLDNTVENALALDSSANLAVAGTLSSKTQVIKSAANNPFGSLNSITRATQVISVSGTTSTCTVTFNSVSSWTNAVIRVRCACTAGGGVSEGAAETIYYTRHVSSTTARTIVATNVTTSAGLVLSIAYGTGTATITATVATSVYVLWDVEVSNFISSSVLAFS
jgi:hypothetical protein